MLPFDNRSLSLLPPEVFENALSYLPSRDIKSLSLTCKAFARPCQRHLLKHLSFDTILSSNRFLEVVKHSGDASLVRSLTINFLSRCGESTAIQQAGALLSALPSLTKLVIVLSFKPRRNIRIPVTIESLMNVIKENQPKASFSLEIKWERSFTLTNDVWSTLFQLENLNSLSLFGQYGYLNLAKEVTHPKFRLKALTIPANLINQQVLECLLGKNGGVLRELGILNVFSRDTVMILLSSPYLRSINSLNLEIKCTSQILARFSEATWLKKLDLRVEITKKSQVDDILLSIPPNLEELLLYIKIKSRIISDRHKHSDSECHKSTCKIQDEVEKSLLQLNKEESQILEDRIQQSLPWLKGIKSFKLGIAGQWDITKPAAFVLRGCRRLQRYEKWHEINVCIAPFLRHVQG
jgi:hypothetical protein